MIERIDKECKVRHTDYIIIMLWANDSRREWWIDSPTITSKSDFTILFAKLLDKAIEIAPTTVIGTFPINEKLTTPVYRRNVHFYLKDIQEYEEIMYEVSKDKKVDYIRIFDQWIKDQDYIKKYIHSDWLHPNSEWHKYITERLLNYYITKKLLT